jgi:hypothetical protein
MAVRVGWGLLEPLPFACTAVGCMGVYINAFQDVCMMAVKTTYCWALTCIGFPFRLNFCSSFLFACGTSNSAGILLLAVTSEWSVKRVWSSVAPASPYTRSIHGKRKNQRARKFTVLWESLHDLLKSQNRFTPVADPGGFLGFG